MEIESISTGSFGANTYIVWTKGDETCIVVDPGSFPATIGERLDKLGLNPEHIVLTHGHFDHIGAVKSLKNRYDAKVMIHALDARMLTSPEDNLSRMFGFESVQTPPDELLSDDQTVRTGKTELKVVHMPGHSDGSVGLIGGGVAFTGDTLFFESIGRTDFPGGDYKKLLASIKEKLLPLPDETRVYPGHGEATDIGHERTHNPFLGRWKSP